MFARGEQKEIKDIVHDHETSEKENDSVNGQRPGETFVMISPRAMCTTHLFLLS